MSTPLNDTHRRQGKGRREIRVRVLVFLGFLAALGTVGILVAIFLNLFISNNVIRRTQREVSHAIRMAWTVYNGQMETLATVADILSRKGTNRLLEDPGQVEELRERYGIDYIIIDRGTPHDVRPGSVVRQTRVLSAEELSRIDPALAERARIPDVPTEMARPGMTGDLTDGLVMEACACLTETGGRYLSVRVGKLLNRNFRLVDLMQNAIFGNATYNGKPVGTVTIFLDDRRIATNVVTAGGTRAIGTRMASNVYEKVVLEGIPWVDRAFVVNDWYLSAYEPIHNSAGTIVGVLYVGTLEKPFVALKRQMQRNLLGILAGSLLICAFLAFGISTSVTRPITHIAAAARAIEEGDLTSRANEQSGVREINTLARAFNSMMETIQNEQAALQAANRNYLNMIAFVSHELKGVLGSITMNVLAVRDRFLGPLTDKQQKALDAAARTLEHFAEMVRNYLDLSRIEKHELVPKPSRLNLAADVIKPSVAHCEQACAEKGMRIECAVPEDLTVFADQQLLTIVCNNLIGNAARYGCPGGRVVIAARETSSAVEVSVYNDGTPIPPEQRHLLFQRFSRLSSATRVKGTGLGLFIAKEIVERHGGTIRHEPHPAGNAFVFTLPRSEP